MDVRRYGVVAALLCVPCSAYSSGHNFDVAAGGTRTGKKQNAAAASRSGTKSASDVADDELGVYGWHVIGALTFHGKDADAPSLWRRLAVVGDVSGHFIQSGGDARLPEIQQITFMLGPRFEFTPPKVGSLMVHALPFGFRLGNEEPTAVVASAGGSWEFPQFITGLRFRLVYDRLFIKAAEDQNRVSVLLTHRFEHK